MAGDTSSNYQPSFGRRGGIRPRFFAQADGDNDSGSLGALLNDVSKVVNMTTGFSGVVLAASSIEAATSNAASNLKSNSTITPPDVLPFKTASASSAQSFDDGGMRVVASSSEGLSGSKASAAPGGAMQQSLGNSSAVTTPATASAVAAVRPPAFGRRGGTGVGVDNMSSSDITQHEVPNQQQQQHQLQQLPQRLQLPTAIQEHQQQAILSSLPPSVSVSNPPVSKFGFRFGGLRPNAAVPIPASTSASLIVPSVLPDPSPVRVESIETQHQSSPPKVSSSSPSTQNSVQRPFVAAHAPSLLSSRASKALNDPHPAHIDVSSRAAQLMREIGDSEDYAPAISSGAALDHVWRERSSRSVAGDVSSHVVAHAKVDTGLPRELASRDRARIAAIYRESERNKKAVERLRAQLQDALSSDRVAMLENAIVERDRVIESLTRDNRIMQRNALIQEKELESKRDIESDVAARVKEKNEDLRIMRERLKKFKELHSEQQKALHAQQQQQQRLQAVHDELRRKLAAALSDPSFDADEARKQLLEKDSHIASLERELRIFRHKKESDGRVKGREHKLKDSKVQQLQSAIEEAQLQLATRGRELQAQSLRIKALEEEVHVWQQRARRPAKSTRNEEPTLSNQKDLPQGEISSQSPFLTDVLDCAGPGLDTKEYRSVVTPLPREQTGPVILQRPVPREKTPPPPRLKTPSKRSSAQISNQQSLSASGKNAESVHSNSGDSIDDQAYVSDFDEIDDVLDSEKYQAGSSVFQPVPPMRAPQPLSMRISANSSSRPVAVPAPTNASLSRGRPR